MWTDFNFYFNASPEFFAKEFRDNNKDKLQVLTDKFGACDLDEYVKKLQKEYTAKTNKDFVIKSEQYVTRKNFLEKKVSNYCISKGFGQSKFIPMIEKELDQEFLNSKNLDFHFNRLLDNFQTYINSSECRKLLKDYEEELEVYVKQNFRQTFIQQGLNKPGTVIVVRRKEDQDNEHEYLIGDVNPVGSFVNDKKHMFISDTSIVVKYRVLNWRF